MIFRKNEGFTLVELMVTILVGTLVTAAAATTILFGLRLNNQSTHIQTQQNTTRILLTILEDMASEGTIGHVETNHNDWAIYKNQNPAESEQPLLYYDDGAIYSGTNASEPLMDGIFASEATYEANDLLTIQIETDTGIFRSTIHCRMGNVTESGDAAEIEIDDDEIDALGDSGQARKKLLETLVANRGMGAFYMDIDYGKVYYAQWYLSVKDDGNVWGQNGWDERTPWCACFISWGLSQVKDNLSVPVYKEKERATTDAEGNVMPYWFANVDEFMDYFKTESQSQWYEMNNGLIQEPPAPGDIIFFDRQVYDGVANPDHVGVVFHVETDAKTGEQTIFTIEGNSMGKVAIREYAATNPTILGYGVLPWKTASTE